MRSLVPLLMALSPVASAQTSPLSLNWTAPVNAVREYRLTETNCPQYRLLSLSISDARQGQEAQVRRSLEDAFASLSAPQTQTFKQFIRVQPGAAGTVNVLFSSVSDEDLTLKSLLSIKPGGSGTLAFQPLPENGDQQTGAILSRLYGDLAGLHADILANFELSAFGVYGQPLRPGMTFTREKTLKPGNPLAAQVGGVNEVQAIRVRQQVQFSGVQEGLFVFARSASIVEPQQKVTGNANLTTRLREYTWTGSVHVRPDGFPEKATRLERPVMESTATVRDPQSGQVLTFTLQVTGESELTLTPVK